MKITESRLRRIIKEELSAARRDPRARSLSEGLDFHVSYPDPRTIRVLVYATGSSTYSGFVEARVGPNQVADLVRQLEYSGLTVDPNDIEAAIEMA